MIDEIRLHTFCLINRPIRSHWSYYLFKMSKKIITSESRAFLNTIQPMKLLNKILPYRTRVALVGLAGGVSMIGACGKSECENAKPQEPEQTIDLFFSLEAYKGYDEIREENLTRVLDSVRGRNVKIYLVPQYNWALFSDPSVITNLRKILLEPAINLSPKISGKGDFNFRTGVASQVPADSLWLVQHGWTINNGR